MDKRINGLRKALALFLALGLSAALTACTPGNEYSTYAAAFNAITANNGLDADLTATLTMDGSTTAATGNFKLDTTNGTTFYYQMNVNGQTVTQFTDGKYLYTDANGEKTMYTLGTKPADPSEPEEKPDGFESSQFLESFASFLEAGKIQELGLFDPIAQAAVSKTTADGNVYILTVSDSLVKQYLNTLADTVVGDQNGDSITVTDLRNFKYSATIENSVVQDVTYSGTMTVEVPGSLTSDGADASYSLDFIIDVDYNNPGSAVSVTLPSTDGYTLIA